MSAQPRDHQLRTAIVQIILSCAMALAIVLLTARLLTRAAGLAAGLIYAVDWTTIIHTPLSIADSIFALPVGLAVLVLALAFKREPSSRAWWLAGLSGLLLGAACLIKPAAEIVVLGLALLALFRLRPWRHVVVFLVAVAIPIVPWAIRNDSVYGEFTISPISTANLYFETALGTYEYRSPLSTDVAGLGALQNRVDAQWAHRHLTPTQRSAAYRRLAVKRIGAKLPIVLDQAVVGLVRTALGTGRDTVVAEWPGAPPPSLVTTDLPLLEVLAFWVLVAFGAYSAWRDRRLPRRVTALLVLATVLALLPAAEPGGYARFRVPAVPMMAVLGGAGLESAARRLQARAVLPRRGAFSPLGTPPR